MYTAFATRDALFYDVPARADLDVSPEFEVDASEDWSGWNTLREDHWAHWLPRGLVLPDQGWKIHISTTPATADKTLLTTSAYCGAHAVPFKHVRSSSTLLSALAKDADRGSAGKFITLYPPTVDALEEHLVS
ncbi:class III lanthionine synthetase LanKC N-terminal domain-containing protein [Microbacterium aurum]